MRSVLSLIFPMRMCRPRRSSSIAAAVAVVSQVISTAVPSLVSIHRVAALALSSCLACGDSALQGGEETSLPPFTIRSDHPFLSPLSFDLAGMRPGMPSRRHSGHCPSFQPTGSIMMFVQVVHSGSRCAGQ